MSYFSPKFMGLTVRDSQTGQGLGSQSSQLTVKCVRDILSGDSPDIPPLGSPCYFQFGGLKYWGLLQRHVVSNGVDGTDLHDFTFVDPREILEGTELVTYGYAGSVFGLANLLNVYGHFEQGVSFGKSEATPAGMPWAKVLQGIRELTGRSTQGKYGGPLSYRGFRYSLDLSELPVPPAYYRIQAGKVGLMEAVTQVCEDSGCDFFVVLDGPVIRVKVISRFFQPPLDTLGEMILESAFDGTVVRSEVGVECRNETTSCFLVGGEKTSVFLSGGVISYWGTAVDGSPVLGYQGAHKGFGVVEFADMNAMDLADVVGNVSYTVNTVELLAALQGPESWGTYVGTYKPELAPLIGRQGYGEKAALGFAPALKQDIVLDDPAVVAAALDTFLGQRWERLYDFVRKAAEDYYGKQYLVQIPFILAKQDPDTFKITTTFEPVGSGYLRYGAAEVGVPANRLDVLQDADDRVLPFAYYPSLVGADTSRVNFGDTVVGPQGDGWTRCSVGPRIIILTGALQIPCVHVRLGSAVYEQKPLAGPTTRDMLFAGNPGVVDVAKLDANSPAGGTMGYADLHPPAHHPAAFGVPLKSNTECYGPWYVAGAPGKVRYEQDPSLTPWEYGSEDLMNKAGQARVVNAVTNTQLSETGSINQAGPPAYSLGDTLKAGGPNLTNVEVSYGPGGVTTNYRFQTFTPRFGLFSRQNVERLKRTGQALAEVRRQARKALNQTLVAQETVERAVRGAKANKVFWQKRQSPHTVFIGQNVTNGTEVRSGVGTETYESSIILSADKQYKDKAVMSVSGLLRPFSTNPSTASPLARYTTPTVPAGMAPVTNATLNPFRSGNDVEVLAWSQTYQGSHARHRGADAADTRAMALRGPLVVSGWGPGIEGNGSLYPQNANLLRRPDLWKTGSVDLLWDNKRGVWSSHDIMSGVLSADLAAGATGVVYVGGSSEWTMNVTNIFSGSISAGKVLIAYVLNLNQWVVSAADCTT